MRNSRPPPISLAEDNYVLAPPQPLISDADRPEIRSTVTHSRTASFTADSPPITPRSVVTFTTPVNPFSPPASVRSFGTDSLMAAPTQLPSYYPFPESPRSTVQSSELPRTSSFYGSRPTTADDSFVGSTRPSSTRFRDTFTPPPARPVTIYSAPSSAKLIRERPKSTMLADDLQKPWLSSRDPGSKLAYFLTYGVTFLGIVAGALKCYFDWQSVPVMKGNLCVVMDEEFNNPDEVFGDNGRFFREVDMSGFGNGEFEMTTSSTNNSFVSDGHLYIVPTLTTDSIPLDAIMDGHIYNISDCTFNITRGLSYTQSSTNSPLTLNTSAIGQDSFDAPGYYKACSAVSNATTGRIINPVQSARLSTRKSASIKYGKVEVRAKIPTGDWLWPAIWMMPVDNTYGGWPRSGEIDIMESRGNGPKYIKQGTNFVRGSLNWGPTFQLNSVLKTTGLWKLRRGSYDQDFHTYTLEWTEDFMRISVDSRLHHLLDLRVKQSFWNRGKFPPVVRNGTDDIVLENPWINGPKNAPFDQRFYLILDVGVGGTNGWFPDGDEKPWLDGSLTAMRDFLQAKDQWYPSWPQDISRRAMVIDSVKMWQQC